MRTTFLQVNLALVLLSCNLQVDKNSSQQSLDIVPDSSSYLLTVPVRDLLYDKLLGSLVGSAIGDAMGAPTEMWNRKDRTRSYGFVDSLDPSFIDPSPEGLWDFHLPIGATTDDTRWKVLVGTYAIEHLSSFYRDQGPDPYLFATQIISAYDQEVDRLKDISGKDPVEIEYRVRRVTWLQEWAPVARAFKDNDLEAYTTALHRFYGGDLLCAGMLYAPMIGLPYPGDPLTAYKAAHRLAIFDQGYARDITGLTAAMVAAAMKEKATPEEILEVFRTVDPHNYFRSRLFGREAFKTFQQAEFIVDASLKTAECEHPAQHAQDELASCRLEQAFELLDRQNQHSPAHAQEILLVSLTAMIYSNYDFQKTLEFITNYGRDNDTSGAVAGAVLGAFHGYRSLPSTIKQQVLETNHKHLGINLEELASNLADEIISTITNPS